MCERRRTEDYEKPTKKDKMESELTHCPLVEFGERIYIIS